LCNLSSLFVTRHSIEELVLAEQAQPSDNPRRHMRPETNAWMLLIMFFVIFCLLVAGSGFVGWNYYTGATMSLEELPNHGLVRVHTSAGVVYQPRGRSDLITPRELCADNPQPIRDVCFDMDEGYRVRTMPQAGFGPVASVVLPDQTQVDLWAHPIGTDLTLETYQVSRWNNSRQEVIFRQDAGYARYDIKDGQPYARVNYTVELSRGVRVDLAPGGSYSIDVPQVDPTADPTDEQAPKLLEVAVRSGSAEIIGPNQRTTLGPRQLIHVDHLGVLSAPASARWDLIRDGDFSDHSSEEYFRGSDTWSVTSSPRLPDKQRNGYFSVISGCRPSTPDSCPAPDDRTTVGQFRREGGQSDQFIIGITQTLDVDVSEYSQLHLTAQTRVLAQSVEGAGIQGSECPLFITLVYKPTSPNDKEAEHWICVYTGKSAPVRAGYIDYFELPRFAWQQLDINLRQLPQLRSVRYLQQIKLEARGHDYLTEFTAVSLIGTE
jgi:hypothetical protein